MTREQIEKQYSKLVSEIEEEKMYDGRGTVDRYICDTCGHILSNNINCIWIILFHNTIYILVKQVED